MKSNRLLTFIMMISVIFISCFYMTHAQISSVTGIVYENDQVKTTFNNPEGTIKVYLPDDMRPGDEVSGMVVIEPKGKNEKEKTKNLTKLLKYGLILPGGLALTTFEAGQGGQQATATPKFTVPREERISINLYSSDNKPLSSAELPTIPYFIESASPTPAYALAKKVITDTEPLVLIQENTEGETPFILLSRYHSPHFSGETAEWYTLYPSVSSLRKTVYYLPEKLCGMYNVNIRFQDGLTKRIDLVNIVNVQASIGKGSLMKGEATSFDIQVLGLEDCPYVPVELEISNLSPSVVQLAHGNQQLFPIDQSDNPTGFIAKEPFCSTQDVIGLVPGTFTVNTTLHIPPAAYSNPIIPYFGESSTVQEYNATIEQLKDDIDYFTDLDMSGTDVNNYLREIRNNLPLAASQDDLKRVKSVTINLLNALALMTGGKEFFRNLPSLNKMHPDIARKTSEQQPVHPLHNYAGEFYPDTKLLIINPDCREELFQNLKATKMSNGNYTITLSDGTNPVTFTDVEINEAELDKDGSKFVMQNNKEKEEPRLDEPLTEGTEFKDKEGRKYKMFKNAQCKIVNKALTIDCHAHYDNIKNENTGEYELRPTGKYQRIIFRETKKCYSGTEICIEMMMVWQTCELYDDVKCTRLIKVETAEEFLDP